MSAGGSNISSSSSPSKLDRKKASVVPQPASVQPTPVISQPASVQPTPIISQPASVQPTPFISKPASITSQPGAGSGAPKWAFIPEEPVPNCPPGLEILSQVGQLYVKQKLELFEAITGFETNNRYEVKNNLNQTVFWAYEDSGCCSRNCCWGTSRPFNIKILDSSQKEIMHLSRPLRCKSCCFPCCLQKMIVEAPKGVNIGYVKQAWHCCCVPKFRIQDSNKTTKLCVSGPCCMCDCCGDLEFMVRSPNDRTHIGHIIKHWSGLINEIFTDVDSYEVAFPIYLDIKIKAVLLGAIFLIDFMYFENDNRNPVKGKIVG